MADVVMLEVVECSTSTVNSYSRILHSLSLSLSLSLFLTLYIGLFLSTAPAPVSFSLPVLFSICGYLIHSLLSLFHSESLLIEYCIQLELLNTDAPGRVLIVNAPAEADGF